MLQHREKYQNFKSSCKNASPNLLTAQQLQKQHKQIKKTLSNQLLNLSKFQKEELNKFSKIYQLATHQIRKMKSQFTKPSVYNQKLYDIFQNQRFRIENEQIRQSSEIQISQNFNLQRQNKSNIKDASDNSSTIKDFFKKKQKEIENKSSSIGFKNILKSQDHSKSFGRSIEKSQPSQSRSEHGSSFRKKPMNKEIQLQKILEQNRKLKEEAQIKMKKQLQLNEFEKNLLKEQKERYMLKIEQMQNEIQTLYRDNYRLKQAQQLKKKQKSKKIDQSSFNQVDEKPLNVYQPYVMKTKHNDLGRLNHKWDNKQIDILGQKLQKQIILRQQMRQNKSNKGEAKSENKSKKIQIKQNNYSKKTLNQDNFILKQLQLDQIQPIKNKSSNKQLNDSFFNNNQFKNNYSINSNGVGFDSFSIAKTSYIQGDLYQQSDTNKFIDSITSTRNKVAFFKNSLILIKNQTFQLAFKRSTYSQKMDKVRLIFFVQNKTNKQLIVDFNYQFNAAYFQLKVNQKLQKIMPYKQSRQDLEINLYSKQDLNQIIDLVIDINRQRYGIWVPVSWIQFSMNNNFQMQQNVQQLNVVPDKQFKNFGYSKIAIPHLMCQGKEKSVQWGYLYGICKFGECFIKLTWQNNQIKIQANQKIIDLMGFILHFVK